MPDDHHERARIWLMNAHLFLHSSTEFPPVEGYLSHYASKSASMTIMTALKAALIDSSVDFTLQTSDLLAIFAKCRQAGRMLGVDDELLIFLERWSNVDVDAVDLPAEDRDLAVRIPAFVERVVQELGEEMQTPVSTSLVAAYMRSELERKSRTDS